MPLKRLLRRNTTHAGKKKSAHLTVALFFFGLR